jgi:hypothetical protein
VYRAGEVAHALEVNVSETTNEDLHNEYLILHIIPARAIIARRAQMVTHGLENKDSTGNNSSNATMTARQSPVSTVQPPGQPSTRGGVALSKSVRQIRGESEYFHSPPGSVS